MLKFGFEYSFYIYSHNDAILLWRIYGTRSKKVNVLRAYYTYGYGRKTPTATGVLRLRLRRTTPTATGVLRLRLRAY